MKNGKCPKCNSSNIYTRRNGIMYKSGGLVIYGLSLSRVLAIWPSGVDTYICTDCGYFENYIAAKEKLPTIAKKWDKVD